MPSLNTANITPDPNTLVSPISPNRPELTISAAAINSEPVELDSTPAPSRVNRDSGRRGSRAGMLQELSPGERQKRDRLIADRKGDPAVMADVPEDPTADELEKSAAVQTSGKGDALSAGKSASSS